MRTPYDSALRVQQRAMDDIRLSLLVEAARDKALADERDALDTDLEREAAIAAIDWQVGVHPYGQRQRARRVGLDADRRALDGRLDRLRDAALAACGQMLAISGAAAGFAGDFRRRENAAEQAHADDINGARCGVPRRAPMTVATAR